MSSIKYFSIAVVMFFFNSIALRSNAQNCSNTKPPTFTVHLPLIRIPPDEEGQGWDRPDIWNGEPASADSIIVPNGRPIYALIISGYASNRFLDEMMLYEFARNLQSKGAYVHYAWWNNLLAPYMERPLHSDQSHPGFLTIEQLSSFLTQHWANTKAFPSEDYQFLSDAKRFLTAIRHNNPNAMIIVAGHSMGGGAAVHLGMQTNEVIDILAPIDPVGNRNFPFAGNLRNNQKDFNWTRWRVTRDNFLGYKKSQNVSTGIVPDCQPTGNWLQSVPIPASDNLACLGLFYIHDAPRVVFNRNIINLHHRWQREYLFPFDYTDDYLFGHTRPNGSISTQSPVETIGQNCGFLIRCPDPDGWPVLTDGGQRGCCPVFDGVGWDQDGHGEIVGYRGPGDPIPMGVLFKSSPRCGTECPNLNWPIRIFNNFSNTWSDPNAEQRRQRLLALESLPLDSLWADRPLRPQLCKVSQGLIQLYTLMNKPPTANAGLNRLVECTGTNGAMVTLDGSASTDPDNDGLQYSWAGPFATRNSKITSVTLPKGTHCITLTVSDPSGHIDKHKVSITVADKIGPVMNVSLTPSALWPPNHKLIDISANVTAFDQCGTVVSIVLYSIVASEGANVVGSGNTSPDIVDAAFNTYDLNFKLRAERSGKSGRRIYIVTYKATDNTGNTTFTSAEVTIENPSGI